MDEYLPIRQSTQNDVMQHYSDELSGFRRYNELATMLSRPITKADEISSFESSEAFVKANLDFKSFEKEFPGLNLLKDFDINESGEIIALNRYSAEFLCNLREEHLESECLYNQLLVKYNPEIVVLSSHRNPLETARRRAEKLSRFENFTREANRLNEIAKEVLESTRTRITKVTGLVELIGQLQSPQVEFNTPYILVDDKGEIRRGEIGMKGQWGRITFKDCNSEDTTPYKLGKNAWLFEAEKFEKLLTEA